MKTGICENKICENCAKEATCKKSIKYIAGFCNSDFEPKKSCTTWKEETHDDGSGIKSFVLSFEHPHF